MTYRVAVVGVGPGRDVDISGRAHSWAYLHADAYSAREDCTIVACADIIRDYAAAFAEEFDVPTDGVYEDHAAMLSGADPDIVSVCTPIPTHADIVIDCARAPSVGAVHCEKPMAGTWAEARAMAHICDLNDVRLTFGHQRRFGEPARRTKALIDDGSIGDLERFEISYGNFFDNGTHTVDLAGYLNDEHRGAWVIGQIDYSKEHVRYGVHTADQAFMAWQYENGVHAVLATGDDVDLSGGPYDFYDCFMRIVGTEGEIEIGRLNGPTLRMRRDGEGWASVDVADEISGPVGEAIDEIVESYAAGRETELRAANALKATEILFAGHESSRQRGRVDLPLTGVYDHPLEAMIGSGEITPTEADDRPPHPAEEHETS